MLDSLKKLSKSELIKIIELQDKKISLLLSEINTLKDKLNINSDNSDLPPSKNIKKSLKNTKRVFSKKKSGGQLGHKGHNRSLSEKADEIIDVKLEADRCICGGSIRNNGYNIHEKIDIRISKHVTHYHVEKGRCTKCYKRYSSNLPNGESKDLLSNNAKALCGYLTGYLKNSRRDLQKLFKELFGLDISLGLIFNNEKRISRKTKLVSEEIRDSLYNGEILHSDETSNNYQGKRGYSWLLANPNSTYISYEASRSKTTLESIIPEYEGYVISDRYAAYNLFDKNKRQCCWAHLVRNFEKFANSSFNEVSNLGKKLKKITRIFFKIYYKYRDKNFEYKVQHKRLIKLRDLLKSYLLKVSFQNQSEQIGKIANNILKDESMMWTFLKKPDKIPITNNHAEQQIRSLVIKRKISLFVWSQAGKYFLQSMMSIYLTCQKRDLMPFDILKNIIAGNIEKLPA